MDAICLVVAGVLRATLPGNEFTLSWQHSVEKIRWDERYRREANALLLIEARVRGHGAGMEPPAGATKVGAAWVWQPNRSLPELVLRRSTAVAPYTLCAGAQCSELDRWVGSPADDGTVVIRPCVEADATRGPAPPRQP